MATKTPTNGTAAKKSSDMQQQIDSSAVLSDSSAKNAGTNGSEPSTNGTSNGATSNSASKTNGSGTSTGGVANYSKQQMETSSKTESSAKKSEKTLENIFEDLLKDTYSAEKQLVAALPEMIKAAYTEDLEDAFADHLQQTKKHVERLDRVFDKLRIEKEEITCEAMAGLIKENKKIISEYEDGPVRDSALIIGSQKIEHYEIAAYGSLCELADVLGWQKIGDLLGRTLEEEEDTDLLLSEIATDVNDEAYDLSELEDTY